MKRTALIFSLFFLLTAAAAQVDFYGSARVGLWYVNLDEDYTGGEQRTEMHYDLYSNSRLGANWKNYNFKANVEFGFKNGTACLRKLYGEYDFGKFSLLVGQTYTGFGDIACQATSIHSGLDDCLIGYGAFYDGRHPMIKFSFKNGPYLMLMEPSKIAPAGYSEYVDALVPKINIGYELKIDNVNLHPTFGFNISQYNEDIAWWEAANPDFDPADSTSTPTIMVNSDELISAYAAALTITYAEEKIKFVGQINYGQNIADYGMATSVAGNAGWDEIKQEVINIETFGGYGQISYLYSEKMEFTGGAGYFSAKLDGIDDNDEAISAFVQLKYTLNEYVKVVPEIGIFDDLEDLAGNVQGSRIYAGTKLQIDF
ncbi:MAG: hypothetical protein JW996_02765 [Candidatus Cloacimonetes bacterium]|nr:hypothetical protein [Candidatus Cloacimonadota bacterium]